LYGAFVQPDIFDTIARIEGQLQIGAGAYVSYIYAYCCFSSPGLMMGILSNLKYLAVMQERRASAKLVNINHCYPRFGRSLK
jgi:hypothetical protein